jgi:hypothetical protein
MLLIMQLKQHPIQLLKELQVHVVPTNGIKMQACTLDISSLLGTSNLIPTTTGVTTGIHRLYSLM